MPRDTDERPLKMLDNEIDWRRQIYGLHIPSVRHAKNVSSDSAKDAYRRFSRREPSIPIFSRDWWLDATAGPDFWDVALVRKGGEVIASMPYVCRQRYGLRLIGQPALTQMHGPWYRNSEGRPATKLAYEKELMQALIDQLPDFDHFAQNWHYTRTNWLPFSWNGFHQTTRYTYVLSGIGAIDKLWAGFRHNVRNECNKASRRYKLRVRDDLPLEAFLALNKLPFLRQGMALPYSEAHVRRLDAACAQRGCRKIFIAVDPAGRLHSGLYIVWDDHCAYSLMAGSSSFLRNSGANSLCYWEAIRHAARYVDQFDFAGSMLEPVERFLRGFGAVQIPYFNISKTPSRLLRLRQGLLSLISEKYGGGVPLFERTFY